MEKSEKWKKSRKRKRRIEQGREKRKVTSGTRPAVNCNRLLTTVDQTIIEGREEKVE